MKNRIIIILLLLVFAIVFSSCSNSHDVSSEDPAERSGTAAVSELAESSIPSEISEPNESSTPPETSMPEESSTDPASVEEESSEEISEETSEETSGVPIEIQVEFQLAYEGLYYPIFGFDDFDRSKTKYFEEYMHCDTLLFRIWQECMTHRNVRTEYKDVYELLTREIMPGFTGDPLSLPVEYYLIRSTGVTKEQYTFMYSEENPNKDKFVGYRPNAEEIDILFSGDYDLIMKELKAFNVYYYDGALYRIDYELAALLRENDPILAEMAEKGELKEFIDYALPLIEEYAGGSDGEISINVLTALKNKFWPENS
ncbi:MAG: hypothetical protein IJK33_00415 [Clostridia bacterium]|nr:hypothetical protein [Clostridia bacterium]